MQAHRGAILMCHSARFINEHADNRATLRPGDFDMYKFETVAVRDTFGDFCNTRIYGTGRHQRPFRVTLLKAQRKSGREPTGYNPCAPSKPSIILDALPERK